MTNHPGKDPGGWAQVPLHRRWHAQFASSLDHERVVTWIIEESRRSGRNAVVTMMSAGIVVLDLFKFSKPVWVGPMLISRRMSPILGPGVSPAPSDLAELRRSPAALIIGALTAVAFMAPIGPVSPLTAPFKLAARAP